MDPSPTLIAVAAVALIVGIVAGIIIWRTLTRSRLDALIAQEKSRLATENLAHRNECERLAREDAARQKEALEKSLAQERQQLKADKAALAEDEARLERREAKCGPREQALTEREHLYERKLEAVDKRDGKLQERESTFEKKEQAITERLAEVVRKEGDIDNRLAVIANLTLDQAKEELLKRLDAQLVAEQSERIARVEKDLQARAKELGTHIITAAIQRYAAEHTAETTVSRIKITDEDMKGRVIGKEGRNIKAFEQATGVDLLIDETPGYLTISCFSGLRREMARRTLETLLADGRIQPARIEEVMAKVEQDMDREVMKLGEDAAYECDVSGLHPQLLKLLGKLQYRTSYGQNVLQHTMECAFLSGGIAAELGLDPKLARRCGLLHDIGKAIDHEQEGSHPQLGYEALKRFGENEIVGNAALAHHEGQVVLGPYTVIAAAADAISAARPGARSKNVENYLKRLEQIEDIACAYQGVQKAYAIQAGRELRVIVSGRQIRDDEMPKLAHDIARRIESEVAYPGEVKVTLIREVRQIAVAR